MSHPLALICLPLNFTLTILSPCANSFIQQCLWLKVFWSLCSKGGLLWRPWTLLPCWHHLWPDHAFVCRHLGLNAHDAEETCGCHGGTRYSGRYNPKSGNKHRANSGARDKGGDESTGDKRRRGGGEWGRWWGGRHSVWRPHQVPSIHHLLLYDLVSKVGLLPAATGEHRPPVTPSQQQIILSHLTISYCVWATVKKPHKTQFIKMWGKEKRQIWMLEKQKPLNVLHFCLIIYLK